MDFDIKNYRTVWINNCSVTRNHVMWHQCGANAADWYQRTSLLKHLTQLFLTKDSITLLAWRRVFCFDSSSSSLAVNRCCHWQPDTRDGLISCTCEGKKDECRMCFFERAHLLPVKPLAHWHCPVSGSHLPLLWQRHSSAQFGPNLPSGHRSVQTAPCREKRGKMHSGGRKRLTHSRSGTKHQWFMQLLRK